MREAVGAMLLLALLLQAAIPAGFMPGAAGSSIVKLCNGRGPDTGAPTQGRPDHHGAPMCPFAAATLLGGIGPWVVNLTISFAAVFWSTPERHSSESARTGPPRAHGPRAPPVPHS
jgi:hypothetical protein